MPIALRRVLRRTEHQFANSRHATRQAGWNSLRATFARYALRYLWPRGTA